MRPWMEKERKSTRADISVVHTRLFHICRNPSFIGELAGDGGRRQRGAPDRSYVKLQEE